MRRHKRSSQILGLGVVASLLMTSVIVGHRLIKNEIVRQRNQPLCLSSPDPKEDAKARCYSIQSIFSRRLTTAMVGQPNGNLLVSSDRASIHLWDLSTKQRTNTLKGHSNWITALTISGNGSLLASADLDGNIKLWRLPSGQLLHTFQVDSVTALALDRAGTVLAIGSHLVQRSRTETSNRLPAFSPYPIQVWNVANRRRLTQINAAEPVNALALSADTQWLAAGATSTKVWHLPSRKLVHRLNSGDLNTLTFNSNSSLLLTGSNGIRGEDGIKVWRVTSGQLVQAIDSVASDLAFSQDGNLLLTTYGGTANLWRLQPLNEFEYLGTLYGSEYSGLFAEFGLNGKAIALGSSHGVKVWFAPPK